MIKIKHFWKNLKYWQKGLITGLIFGSLFIFLALNMYQREFPILIDILFNKIALHPLDLAVHIVEFYKCYTGSCILNVIIIALVIYGLIGIVLGCIYEQIKKLF
jgi:hypothetical protein